MRPTCLTAALLFLMVPPGLAEDRHAGLSAHPGAPVQPADFWGDSNEDGSIGSVDALICLSDVVGLDVAAFDAAACDVAPDVDSDSDGTMDSFSGSVTAVDALAILTHAVALPTSPNVRVGVAIAAPLARECDNPSPAWVWCDDFDEDRLASYFEIHDDDGDLQRVAGAGVEGSVAMEVVWQAGEVSAGNLKLAVGSSADPGYVRPADDGVVRYRDLYWRMYVRHQEGWMGGGAKKLSRAFVMATSSWAQAALGHVWTPASPPDVLAVEPVRGTDAQGTLLTTVINDGDYFTWLGQVPGTVHLFADSNAGTWYCVEARMRLNDPGLSNGLQQLWIDGVLDAEATDLNFLGDFDEFGINTIFFENYWNGSSPVEQRRYFDNIVVSTERIGCEPGTPGASPPVAAVVVSSSGGSSVSQGGTLDLAAQFLDQHGTEVPGAPAWSSVDDGVASVGGSGTVTGVSAGTTYIHATAPNGKTGGFEIVVVP